MGGGEGGGRKGGGGGRGGGKRERGRGRGGGGREGGRGGGGGERGGMEMVERRFRYLRGMSAYPPRLAVRADIPDRQVRASSRQSAAAFNWPRATQSMRFVHRGDGLIFTPASVMSKLIKSSPACSGPEYVFRVSATISSIGGPERFASPSERCGSRRRVSAACGRRPLRFRRQRVVVDNAADTIFCSRPSFELLSHGP